MSDETPGGTPGNGHPSKLTAFWSGDRQVQRELADEIEAAVQELIHRDRRGHRKLSAFVSKTTILARRSFAPSDTQRELYDWIKARGFVPREWTVGMHVMILGGLMARGLVEDAFEDGAPGIRVVSGAWEPHFARREAPRLRAAARAAGRRRHRK